MKTQKNQFDEPEISVHFAFLISEDSYSILEKIDKIVLKNRKNKQVFHRSKDIDSSFYPKIHFLTSRDVRIEKVEEVKEVWKQIKKDLGDIEMGFHITKLELVSDGLLLLKLETVEKAESIRKKVADSIKNFRTGSVTEGKGGDKHWYSFPHISIGANISSDEFEKISRDLKSNRYIDKKLNFFSPVMYIREGEWDEETKLKYC